ncbi:MAG: transketolase family protein [Nitrospinaceae bacterium]|nr:transketolase family protein [Nitrospinaceae bacterium]NIR56613.1 transketolase family protein [Nitrospinaceae bacterium]NIS87076.1 transketolase family protein [Nitrospinaceae bacterium]NIT83930.1 transketolase family protein [Nitrospinaceae bacterium]NIU46121.1 transketolase family protein [Nitrospinaceae bacterium]
MKDAATRDGYGEALLELGEHPELVVLDAGVSDSTRTGKFGKKYPQKFFNMGISEADMVCTAAGLATTGKIPFATSFACFLLGRTMDQVLVSLAYSNTNVKLAGTHAGVAVGEDGPTAQMIADLAYTRALPNMVVIQPADWEEARQATRAVLNHPGPVYLRLGRPKVRGIYAETHPFEIGKAHLLKEGTDVVVFATGIMVQESLDAAEQLEKDKIHATVVNISTLKPIDRDRVLEQARKNAAVVTAEDHNRFGGLGDAVADVLLEDGYRGPFKKVAVADQFAETGSTRELFEKYGLSARHIAQAVKEVVGRKK